MFFKKIPTNVLVIVAVLISVSYILFHYAIPHFTTTSRIEDAARMAKARDLRTGYCFEDMLDGWDKPICIQREVAPDKKAIAYTAISTGRDGVFDTEDDYKKTKIDLNKTRIVGEWLGQRAKRGFEGFVDGVRTPDKFKDKKGTDGTPRKPNKKKSWKFWKHEQ